MNYTPHRAAKSILQDNNFLLLHEYNQQIMILPQCPPENWICLRKQKKTLTKTVTSS